MDKLEQIRQQRGQQYGSFKENMLKVDFISLFFIEDISTAEDIEFLMLRRQPQKNLIFAICNFSQQMLALKAVRSLSASGDVYMDCIYDFLNYKYLAEKELAFLKRPIFYLNKLLFNDCLNMPQPQNIKWLINNKNLNYYYKLYASKFKYDEDKFREFLKEQKND